MSTTTDTVDEPRTPGPQASASPHESGKKHRPGGFRRALARIRRGLTMPVLLSVVAALLLVLGAAYFLTMAWLLGSAAEDAEVGDYDAGLEKATTYRHFALMDRHKGPFATGTIHLYESDLDAAETDLLRALDMTPVADECAVRQNLSFTYESRAEEAKADGRTDVANLDFGKARTTLEQAPAECRPAGGDQDEEMKEAGERIDESQKEMNDPNAGQPSDDGSDGDSQPGGGGSTDEQEESEGGAGTEESETGEADGKREQLQERDDTAERRQQEEDSQRRHSGVGDEGKPW